MNRAFNDTRQLIAATLFAVAGSAAFAGTIGDTGDITRDTDTFVGTKSRAEVKAGVLQARAAGVTQFVTEGDAAVGAAPTFHTTVTRDQVRADLRNAPRGRAMIYNPAA